jgi:hypothetical protein
MPLDSLFTLSTQPQAEAEFSILPRRRAGRWRIIWRQELLFGHQHRWWALPRQNVGDAPHLYHPLYVMAVLSASPFAPEALVRRKAPLQSWPVPHIEWSTREEVRRSMTLNGMRMSTEYWQTGSTRVLQLVESRLGEGQRDIVHDVLVYLMRQVLDVRSAAQEARDLRAEAVAAFLGLQEPVVRTFFAQERLSLSHLRTAIDSGVAGPVRRALDVSALLRNQLQHLRPHLNEYSQQETRWQWLIDQVTKTLYMAP